MNTANFSEYLQNPSLLYQISYEELKTLIVQYPYSQNLRYLITQKSNMENNSDYDNHLRSAAIISTDRPHLYHILKEQKVEVVTTDNFILEEEALELKNLNELDLNKVELEPVEEVISTPSLDLQAVEQKEQEEIFDTFPELSPEGSSDIEEELTFDKLEEDIQLPTLEEEESIAELISDNEVEVKSTESAIEQLIDDTAGVGAVAGTAAAVSVASLLNEEEEIEAPKEEEVVAATPEVIAETADLEALFETEVTTEEVEVIEEEAIETPKVNPIVKFTPQVTSISQLLDKDDLKQRRRRNKTIRPLARRQLIKNNTRMLQAEEVAKNIKQKEARAEEYANRSIEETTDIASETYASLLIRQNQYVKAIQVYDRLKLIFPEKSAFFAEQIQSLEGKL